MNDQEVDQRIRDFVRYNSDFDIDRYSDKGGFGHLYFGRRKITQNRVALKFYTLDGSKDEHAEPLALQGLENPNILKILDARYLDEDIAFYVTPEISGGDLDHYIAGRHIKTATAISIVEKILFGLNELHSEPRNWVHMDLKVGNILIDLQKEIPFIADFGSIRRLSPGQEYTSKGQYTVPYMPPEAILHEKHYKQSDIYQVGLILFQLLHGEFPANDPTKWLDGRAKIKFQAISDFDDQYAFLENYVKNLIAKGKLVNLDKMPVHIGRKLKSILKTALDTDYRYRYQNCMEFLKALYKYQQESKNWWIENSDVCAFSKETKKYFRITKHKGAFLVKSSNDQIVWRKVAEVQDVKAGVSYIYDI